MAVTQGRVLVTGGAGFIGVNLAPALADLGFATRCFDNLTTGRRDDAVKAGYDERGQIWSNDSEDRTFFR